MTTRTRIGLGYHADMRAPGGSVGSGHGSDPDEEALQRRIREFLRHGAATASTISARTLPGSSYLPKRSRPPTMDAASSPAAAAFHSDRGVMRYVWMCSGLF